MLIESQKSIDEIGSPPRGADGSSERAITRRSFLGVLLGTGVVGVSALLALPVIRFIFYPAFAKTTVTEWSDLGAVEEFGSITGPVTRIITFAHIDGWRESMANQLVYVTKSGDGRLKVLSSVCPHLGCSVIWRAARGQFICPCHNGVFKTDGTLISGPPARAMDELQSRVEDGRLKVLYQYFRPLVGTKEVVA